MRTAALVALAGAGLVAGGAGVFFASHPLASGRTGWTAYSPLTSTSFVPLIGAPWWSLLLTAAGFAVLGAAVALLVARGRRTV